MGVEHAILLAVAGALGYALYRVRQAPPRTEGAPPRPVTQPVLRIDGEGGLDMSRVRVFADPVDRDTALVEVSGLPREIAIEREGMGTAMQKRLGTRELETGDVAFDEELFVLGPSVRLRAVLDQETRALMVRVFRGQMRSDVGAASVTRSVELKDGVLRARVVGQTWLTLREDVFGDIARALLDVARRLEIPGDIVERLARNARSDAQAAVRLRNLLALAREYPGHEVTRSALMAAGSDQDSFVRLEAALALGDEGRETLLSIVDGTWTDDRVVARAVETLGSHLPLARHRTVLHDALRGGRLPIARASLVALGRAGGPEAIDLLAGVLASRTDELGALAARSLGATRDARAERPLLDALARGGSPALREEMADALGLVGSVAAVPVLREIDESVDEERATHRAARVAIARIQARLTGASPGQLAIADGGSGQLSLGDDATGRLALEPGGGPAKPDA